MKAEYASRPVVRCPERYRPNDNSSCMRRPRLVILCCSVRLSSRSCVVSDNPTRACAECDGTMAPILITYRSMTFLHTDRKSLSIASPMTPEASDGQVPDGRTGASIHVRWLRPHCFVWKRPRRERVISAAFGKESSPMAPAANDFVRRRDCEAKQAVRPGTRLPSRRMDLESPVPGTDSQDADADLSRGPYPPGGKRACRHGPRYQRRRHRQSRRLCK